MSIQRFGCLRSYGYKRPCSIRVASGQVERRPIRLIYFYNDASIQAKEHFTKANRSYHRTGKVGHWMFLTGSIVLRRRANVPLTIMAASIGSGYLFNIKEGLGQTFNAVSYRRSLTQ